MLSILMIETKRPFTIMPRNTKAMKRKTKANRRELIRVLNTKSQEGKDLVKSVSPWEGSKKGEVDIKIEK